MDRIVIVTGIPGTGKTTICTCLQKIARNAGLKLSVINYGNVMMEISKKHGKIVERDDIRKDNVTVQRQLQREAAETISEEAKSSNNVTIVDTHLAIRTSEGFLPGLPNYSLQLLKPEQLFLVEAQPDEISSRRMKNSGRKRDQAAIQSVREELLFSRLMAGACSVLTSAPVKIVINSKGKQKEAAKEILESLRGV